MDVVTIKLLVALWGQTFYNQCYQQAVTVNQTSGNPKEQVSVELVLAVAIQIILKKDKLI